jgi:hypothetical protein
VTIQQHRRLVHVWTPDGEQLVVDPADHREDVVRRLLARGVSATTLRALLPTWDGMITRIAGPPDAAAPATAPERTEGEAGVAS